MIVFLEKVRINTNFSLLNPIVTEPLELMYVKEVLDQEGIENYVIDTLFEYFEPVDKTPELIILTGYNVAEKSIKDRAMEYKRKYKDSKIMVSGVHAQINRSVFRDKGIDYVYFSQSLETFRSFIKANNKKHIDYFDKENNRWIIGEDDTLYKNEEISPNREFYNRIKDSTKYIDKRGVSLIKGSHGCPYSCNFCYCRLLNSSLYIKSDYKNIFDEMNKINSEYFWIVDDTLFVTRTDAIDFIKCSKESSFRKKIIGYLRADYIMQNKDLLHELKQCGLDEVIIGFESPDTNTLIEYNKSMNSNIYEEVVDLLRDAGIDLTALFIVSPDSSIKDFILLNRFIKRSKIQVYTLSIMTPLKGTKDYEDNKDRLITNDPRKFDFLHLVVPSVLPKYIFYSLFYWSHLRLLKSKRIRKMLRGSL